ncbi:TadE family protein [Parvibaculum lavamentivorans DS-1]|uniref:TadE family protein n=1 Tax=Parvibaculum lavamentivorans (strain DS-1 / DSM 13023 / NCIMB 13966) TaxID=402881 RepID=A7HPL6_PARL1|nr:TadE/TadG family type IV pilus assembly protein [Parvibaculum lavamentivorans]ABS61849.1 TadE family protein [Parvibaculum lavamentivorans DS-1]
MNAKKGRQGRRFGFIRAKEGSVAVEFSMLAIPFFALLYALIETCIVYFATSNLDSVVADAGRLVRTGQVQAGGMSEAQFKGYICDRMTLVSNCASDLRVDVRNFTSFNGVSFPPLIDANGNVVENTVFQPGNAGDIVLVRVYYTWGVMSPGLIGLSNVQGNGRLIAASVAFRNEPFSTAVPTT